MGPPAVPRADVLADVAAEDLAAETGALPVGDGALQLDGQVADAARGVEDVRGGQGAGRARVEARGAAPAHVGAGGVGKQLEVGDQLAEEEPRAVLRVQEAGVLAPGAEPGG